MRVDVDHLCAAIPNFRIMEIDVDDVPWRDDLVTRMVKNGMITFRIDQDGGQTSTKRLLRPIRWSMTAEVVAFIELRSESNILLWSKPHNCERRENISRRQILEHGQAQALGMRPSKLGLSPGKAA